MNINKSMEQIVELVHQTRPIIMDMNSRSSITEKGLADFVTEVDTKVQSFLKSKLEEAYPEVQFMGEEGQIDAVDGSRPTWVLDPIDGTTNLIYDYHHSAVSLAYYEGGRICAAIIYNPFSDETFSAVRGKGAFLNGTQFQVSTKPALEQSLIAIGTSPYEKEYAPKNFRIFEDVFMKSLDIRRGGSAALDLAYVACGRIDGYFERNLKPWDLSAGVLLVEEAGGRVTDYAGAKISLLKNQDILATNGNIHDELLSCLKV